MTRLSTTNPALANVQALDTIDSSNRYALIAGGIIIAAATNATICKTGGYLTSSALLVMALAAGVYSGAYVIGRGQASRAIAAAILTALAAGEVYNCIATAERIVTLRDEAQAPLKALAARHGDAIGALEVLRGQDATSPRLTLAKAALADARGETESARTRAALAAATAAHKAVDEEAANVRCFKECERKQGVAAAADIEMKSARAADAAAREQHIAAAETELRAATVEAGAQHTAAVAAAETVVAANPIPPSATPLADRIGWAPWVLDLMVAGLLSIGANGLAGALVAYGASPHRPTSGFAGSFEAADLGSDSTGQSDFPLPAASVPHFGPDGRRNGGPSGGPGPDRPRRPGPSGGLTKEAALSDLLSRLADGRTIPSNETLVSDWDRPKQTVSDWMREWRRIGIIPAAIPAGRCKATAPV